LVPNRQILRFRQVSDSLQAARSRVARLNARELIVVGATRASADEFVRQIEGPGSLGVHRTTLLQLAQEIALAPMAERNLGPVSRLCAEAVAARVAHGLKGAKRLSYFAPVVRLPGFPGALASTFSELRLAYLRPEDLKSSQPSANDLRLLLAEYEQEL